MAIPSEGEIIQIHSYKHNGRIHRVWQETMVLKATKNIVIGANERTLVIDQMVVLGLQENHQFAIFTQSIGLILFVC